MIEKSDHVLNELVDLVKAGEDIEHGFPSLDSDVLDLVVQDAEQFFVMAKLAGNHQRLRGQGRQIDLRRSGSITHPLQRRCQSRRLWLYL